MRVKMPRQATPAATATTSMIANCKARRATFEGTSAAMSLVKPNAKNPDTSAYAQIAKNMNS
jgi:hypothetical protein